MTQRVRRKDRLRRQDEEFLLLIRDCPCGGKLTPVVGGWLHTVPECTPFTEAMKHLLDQIGIEHEAPEQS
jgi:hypothetical protein